MLLFMVIPEKTIPFISGILSSFVFHFIPYRKKVIQKQLALVFPEKSNTEIIQLTKDNYQHLILFIFEFILLFKWKNDKVLNMTSIELKDSIEKIKSEGGIMLSGHFGNWEIFMRALCINNFPLSAIMKRQKNHLVNNLIDKWRNDVGMEIVYTGGALKKSLYAIKNKRIICIMGDQDARKRGIFSTFFGQKSSTHIGAALMAYKFDKNVIIGFGVREKFKRYNAEFYSIDVKILKKKADNDKGKFVQLFVDEYNLSLEKIVRKYPEQYFWFHKRWKTPYKGKKIIVY